MTISYNEKMYNKNALIKAAYHFTDVAYIHLDYKDGYYLVKITPKPGESVNEEDFENEMLTQMARQVVLNQTREIRKISLARALGSSVIEIEQEPGEDLKEENLSEDTEELENSILKDWFDK